MLTLKDSLSESILFWGGNGNSLQYSNRDNPMDRGAWQTTVRGVSKSQTQLSNWAHQESILYREQTYGHGERGGEGEMYGESNTETYITICKIDSQWEFAVCFRKPKNRGSVSTWRGGMGREMGGRFRREGPYVHLRLIHVEVWQKTTKFCKAIILQLKNK